MFKQTLLGALLRRSIFASSPLLAFTYSVANESEIAPEDGLYIGRGKQKAGFVRYPSGEFRRVDVDFDPSVFDDPDSIPRSELNHHRSEDARSHLIPDLEPVAHRCYADRQSDAKRFPKVPYHDLLRFSGVNRLGRMRR